MRRPLAASALAAALLSAAAFDAGAASSAWRARLYHAFAVPRGATTCSARVSPLRY